MVVLILVTMLMALRNVADWLTGVLDEGKIKHHYLPNFQDFSPCMKETIKKCWGWMSQNL